MRIRWHKGALDDSLATVETIEPTREAVTAWANRGLNPFNVHASPALVLVKPYCYDERIQWDTYIVTLEGYGVLGFCDAPVS